MLGYIAIDNDNVEAEVVTIDQLKQFVTEDNCFPQEDIQAIFGMTEASERHTTFNEQWTIKLINLKEYQNVCE